MMLESGPIRLHLYSSSAVVRALAVIITHKKWVSGKTFEDCFHKKRREKRVYKNIAKKLFIEHFF